MPDSPLHVAVMYQRKDVIDLLIAQGADVNAPDTQGMTALQHALDLGGFLPDYDAPGMVAFLRSRGAQDDIYTLMWGGADEDFAAFLRDHPEAANAKSLDGATPLCLVGSVERTRLLLAHGANLHARIESDSGMTPRGLAEAVHDDEIQRAEVIAFLREISAPI